MFRTNMHFHHCITFILSRMFGRPLLNVLFLGFLAGIIEFTTVSKNFLQNWK